MTNHLHCELSVNEADADLRERVRLYLIHSGHLPVRLLDVEAQSGIVTLRGTVPTFYFRQLAVEAYDFRRSLVPTYFNARATSKVLFINKSLGRGVVEARPPKSGLEFIDLIAQRDCLIIVRSKYDIEDLCKF